MSQGAFKLTASARRQQVSSGEAARQPEGVEEMSLSETDGLEARLLEITRRNEKLEQLNACFEAALDQMGRGLSMFDHEHRLVVCNKTYANIYSLPDELTRPGTAFAEILGYHMRRAATPALARRNVDDWIKEHVSRLAIEGKREEIQTLSGGRSIRVTYQPIEGGGWVDMQEDITAQRQADEKIEWLARHDTLTEISNRFHFREQLEHQFQSYDPRLGFALHWIDLDHFKQINDQYGHPAGDGLLKLVAERLRSSLRAGDAVGRLGGDEFAILQVGVDRAELADNLSRRLLQTIRRPYDVLGQRLHIQASIGVALAPQHGQNPEDLFASADAALYQAKSLGRGMHALYAPGSTSDHQVNPLKRELEHALDRDELVLHYHPIVDLRAERVSSFEALMRWRHPSRGMIPPSEFIPLAEETRLIVPMGSWALTRACIDAMTWPEHIKVSVNLSTVQIECSDVYECVTEALAESGLPPERLQLEITETVLMRDREHTKEVLQKLHELGVMMTLDDFGTCFATLNYLRRFPFRKIKIDRSFVRDIPEQHDCVAIVKSVGELARELKMLSVAEGVETAASLACVTAAGYDEVQGFYFSPPVPASAVPRAIKQCKMRLSANSTSATPPAKSPRKPSAPARSRRRTS